MTRPLIVVLLLVIVAGGAWYIYEDSQETEIEIEMSDNGISIEEN